MKSAPACQTNVSGATTKQFGWSEAQMREIANGLVQKERWESKNLGIRRRPAIGHRAPRPLQVRRDARPYQSDAKLDGWLRDAMDSGIHAMLRFVNGLKRDLSAVRNALITKWSSGQIEGQVFHAAANRSAAVCPPLVARQQ